MRWRRVACRRKFYGVLRWFSIVLLIAVMFASLPLPVGSEAKGELNIVETVAPTLAESTEPDPGSIGLVPLLHTTTYQPEKEQPTEPQDEAEPKKVEYMPLYTEPDAIALAQMGWGEALVTQSDTEIAATMWCALNRYDCGDPYYRNCKSIEAIVKQSGAFDGYSASNPVDEHLLWLAYDVLERWNAEQYGETEVGRVLPGEYLYFHGDGRHNYFRIEFKNDGQYYDWSLGTPYES
ncbi:MAG: hypothetical protein IKJ99_03775 [Oscillospiraceae bacterium]|nr:hypothetical protein [Oscillospiraceae bacterium]